MSLVMIILVSAVIVSGIAGNNNNATLWKANLEALSEIESPYCHNGGQVRHNVLSVRERI